MADIETAVCARRAISRASDIGIAWRTGRRRVAWKFHMHENGRWTGYVRSD